MSDRSLRGMRLGAQSMESESGVEPAPRQRVEYRCADGEQVFVTFAAEAEIPPVWTSKTGKEAILVDGEKPVDANEKADLKKGEAVWMDKRNNSCGFAKDDSYYVDLDCALTTTREGML